MREFPNISLRCAAVDFGLVQSDPRNFSLAATARKLKALAAGAEHIIARERVFLCRERADALWCDIPFIPFEAAAREGVPAVGMGNFSWDWIYGYYAGADPVFAEAADLARGMYSHALMYFELPHSPPPSAFPRRERIPLVARAPRFPRAEARRLLGIADGECAVLLGFSELRLGGDARARLAAIARNCAIRYIVPAPMRLDLQNAIIPDVPDFTALVSASDLIVTKLGYGIVCDAIQCRVPLVYTERGDFPELPYLEALVRETVGGVFLSRADFESGAWGEALQAAPGRGEPRAPYPLDGAEQAARRFLELAGL
jgi:L-arabinokinase